MRDGGGPKHGPPTRQSEHERDIVGRCGAGAPEPQGKKSQNRETKGHKVEAVTSTCLPVLVLLRLLNNGQSRNSISLAPTSQGDPDKVHTAVAIVTQSIKEDVRQASEAGTATRLGPLLP